MQDMKVRTFNHNETLLGEFAGNQSGYKAAFSDAVDYLIQTESPFVTIKQGDREIETVTYEWVAGIIA